MSVLKKAQSQYNIYNILEIDFLFVPSLWGDRNIVQSEQQRSQLLTFADTRYAYSNISSANQRPRI